MHMVNINLSNTDYQQRNDYNNILLWLVRNLSMIGMYYMDHHKTERDLTPSLGMM